MSRKKHMHSVSQTPAKNPLHCGTITREDLRRIRKGADRRVEIEAGVYESPIGRGIVHGGDTKTQNRRARREGKQDTRNWRNHVDD